MTLADEWPWRFQGLSGASEAIRHGVKKLEIVPAGDLNTQSVAGLVPLQTWQSAEIRFHQHAYRAGIAVMDIDGESDAADRAIAQKRIDDLVALVRKCVNVEVTSDLTNVNLRPPLFDGRRVANASLSDGQKVLTAWALMLCELSENPISTPHIYAIDEPELHLHPSACIEVLQAFMRSVHPDSQLWVATHSVSLVVALNAEDGCLYYVRDGQATYAGNEIDRLVDGLVGGQDRRLQLATVLADAADAEFFKFTAGAFHPEPPAKFQAGDVQNTQVADNVAGDVLDYSPGRGRLIMELAAIPGMLERVQYHALAFPDKSTAEELEDCQQAMETAYPGTAFSKRLFSSTTVALGAVPDGFDWVVLCNTLHEIDATEWKGTFSKIQALLKPTGHLLLMEDQRLPRGELPHPKGYVVLELPEVRALFDANAGGVQSLCSDERLTVFRVDRAVLDAVTAATVCETLKRVKSRSKECIARLVSGKEETTARNVRRHAFFCMLYFNADRQLEPFD